MTMNYEQKYKEALERAREIHNENRAQCADVMTKVFPELKENEDERIRKALIALLNFSLEDGSAIAPGFNESKEQALAWLEKQGNVDTKLIQYREYLVSETERWHKAESDKTNSAIGKQDCTGHANAFISARSEFEKVFNWDDLIAKQGEKPQGKSIIKAWKDMRLEVYQQASGNRHEPNCSDDNTKMFSLNDIDEIIEKMSEQKHADNIEPKFKVGDWVVLNENRKSIYQVERIETYHYVLSHILGGTFHIPFCYENSMRLWTIKDAKDGDMIYEKSTESIILFKSDDCDWIDSHCSYWQKTKIFERGKRQYGRVSEMNICPTTKEQRDLFFQRMHEAGYDWDAEKKQVIKL